jgi:TRAP-type C4-dicarboxylate transport system permease small subunit
MILGAASLSLISAVAALLFVARVCGGAAQLQRNLVIVDISERSLVGAVVPCGFALKLFFAHAQMPPQRFFRDKEGL